jgi:hypothetical protein
MHQDDIANLLEESNFKVRINATDEDGDEHRIQFKNSICSGEIYVSKSDGILYIRTNNFDDINQR